MWVARKDDRRQNLVELCVRGARARSHSTLASRGVRRARGWVGGAHHFRLHHAHQLSAAGMGARGASTGRYVTWAPGVCSRHRFSWIRSSSVGTKQLKKLQILAGCAARVRYALPLAEISSSSFLVRPVVIGILLYFTLIPRPPRPGRRAEPGVPLAAASDARAPRARGPRRPDLGSRALGGSCLLPPPPSTPPHPPHPALLLPPTHPRRTPTPTPPSLAHSRPGLARKRRLLPAFEKPYCCFSSLS